jgi:hypothetical protein
VSTSIGTHAPPAYRAPVNRARQTVAIREVLKSVWTDPRGAVRLGVRSDAARLVITVAFLGGILDGLQNLAIGKSLKPEWGPFAVLFALVLGPLIGLVQFALFGALIALVGRMLGGSANASDVRIALACSRVPELVALPFWIPVLAVYGTTVFEKDPPFPVGVLAFLLIQAALLIWACVLKVVAVAEAHGFSCWRAFAAMVLAWLVPVLLVVAVGIGFGALSADVKA